MADQIATKLNSKQRKAEAKRLKAEQEAARLAAIANAPTPDQTPEQDGTKPEPKVKTPKLTKTGLVALPRLKRMRKPKAPKICACGCGGNTKGGRFIPGHDARLHGWALRVERKQVTIEQVAAADGQGVADAVKAHIAAATKAKAS